MKFRPCIDIHNGKVKQIVGSSLQDQGNLAVDNYISQNDAAYYAHMYRFDELSGGHMIMLNTKDSEYHEENLAQVKKALNAYPGGLQVGGGITDENAGMFIEQGASHVIVTSFVFQDGCIYYINLNKLVKAVGKERIVLDLSCRKRDGKYYVVTNRWQNFTDVKITEELLQDLSQMCDEFLIHGADVEGKVSGIEEDLVKLVGKFDTKPITYAGGIHSFDDIRKIKRYGKKKIDFSIGSALDLFGGKMDYNKVRKMYNTD